MKKNTTHHRIAIMRRFVTEQDKVDMPVKNAQLHGELEDLKLKAKEKRREISRFSKVMARAMGTGQIVERIPVTDTFDLSAKTMTTTRDDTGETVLLRAMTSAELQMDFADLPGAES